MDSRDNMKLSRTKKMTETTQKASSFRGDKSTINRWKLFGRVIKTIIIPVLLLDFTIWQLVMQINLRVSAWTQSVDNRKGPRFLSVGKTFGFDFSSCSSSRSCLERLVFQLVLLTAMLSHSSWRTAKSLSSRSGFSRGGFQPVET